MLLFVIYNIHYIFILSSINPTLPICYTFTIMRNNIVHPGAGALTYEIRGIVKDAHHLADLGVDIIWENIGDPIAKGVVLPEWIKSIVKDVVSENSSYGYSPTAGTVDARETVADMRAAAGCTLAPDDILFFNGLGDAIATIYSYLNQNSKVIGPNPAYSTHSSAESAHSQSPHITYTLDPHKNWLPDIDDLRNKIKYNPAISGILIINPDNPTGMVYPKAILEQIVSIAREYNLFIISDEVYANVSFGDEPFVPLYDLIGDDVPALVMRGLSKEIPWPGARCGWIEFHNRYVDPIFEKYVESLFNAKMLQVCATTLPQQVIPRLFTHENYKGHLKDRAALYKRRAEEAYVALRKVSGVIAPKPEGALYFTVVFQGGTLSNTQSLQLEGSVKEFMEEKVQSISPDKRFVYYLMAKTGICVVPLSGFNSDLYGFRMTLLEPDDEKFTNLLNTITESIKEYVKK